jgi:hypothetical protein
MVPGVAICGLLSSGHAAAGGLLVGSQPFRLGAHKFAKYLKT